jgi:hypothetical protein
LTDNGKQNLNQQIQNNLKGKIMISPIGERYAAIGREEGITIGESRGIAKGKVEGIISILDVKFGEISETVRDSLYAVTDNDRLKNLLRFAAKCESFEEFDNELKSTM